MAADGASGANETRIRAGAADAGRRIDEMLARALGIGRRAAARLVADVRLNGRRAAKGARVAAGDLLVVRRVADHEQRANPLELLRALPSVVVVAKPAALPSVALRGALGDSLAARIAQHFPECADVGRPGESGLVHRLDTGTSGLLLAARTSDAYSRLREEFRAHRVEKEYLALVGGRLEHPTRITTPVGQHRASRRRMRVVDEASGRRYVAHPAETEVEPLRALGRCTLVRARSTTGVRHQIRVHLASVGHPLVNDPLYGEGAEGVLPGFLLHASALRWRDPDTGQVQDDSLPLPAVWQRIVDELAE